jgi:hypothetical protein
MTTTPVKLDEILGRTHVEFLRQAGYGAERVHKGCLAVADETQTRVRRPPVTETTPEESEPPEV